eukprot:Protomagalhaensia_sp_Gyna_25__6079@NODE_974_length_2340_cov_6_883529_g774_i0_p2_GENE_NODE_974_length_2340_cov_6_883529_g774_i0NODE_974_length_2340_cov_6_883529_g774_i0_p2_ORF_typecomplete_len244_score14_21_NODE_974_length_2340_cov_6_883529_g774_i010611792
MLVSEEDRFGWEWTAAAAEERTTSLGVSPCGLRVPIAATGRRVESRGGGDRGRARGDDPGAMNPANQIPECICFLTRVPSVPALKRPIFSLLMSTASEPIGGEASLLKNSLQLRLVHNATPPDWECYRLGETTSSEFECSASGLAQSPSSVYNNEKESLLMLIRRSLLAPLAATFEENSDQIDGFLADPQSYHKLGPSLQNLFPTLVRSTPTPQNQCVGFHSRRNLASRVSHQVCPKRNRLSH